MKIALCVNHDKYQQDGIFAGDQYVESHLRKFFSQVRNEVKARGDEIHTLDFYKESEKVDVYLFFDYPYFNPLEYSGIKRRNYRRMLSILKPEVSGRKLLYIWESPLYNKGNYTEENYRKFEKVLGYAPLPTPNYQYFPYSIESVDADSCRIIGEEEFRRRKLSCMITSNKLIKGNGYDLRYEIVDYFESKPDKFDLYGVDWIFHGLSKAARMALGKKYAAHPPKNYQGPCESKRETFNQYRFGFAIENQYQFPGYVSEKLFDVLTSDCVPVYTGSNILEGTVPKDLFVDIEAFASLAELEEFLAAMPYETYVGYLRRKIEFLQTERFRDYFHEANVKRLMDVIYGIRER